MAEERKLFKNISFVALSIFMPNILNLALLMIVARILLNSGMNDYSVTINYVTMFALISDIGTSGIIIRDIARDHSLLDKYFGTYFSIRLATTSIMVFLSLIIVNVMPYEPYLKNYILIAALSQFLFQISQIFYSIFQSYERMEYIAYGLVLQSVVYFITAVVLVDKNLGNMGVPGLIYANLLSSVVILVTYALLFRGKITSIKLGFDKKLFKHLVLAGLPFGIAGILNILYSYIDRFILSMIRFTEVANYTLPYTLVMSLTFILSAYNVALFPMFSKLSVTKADSLEYACEKSFKYLLILILPICVGTTLLADRIINTIYGPDFSGSIPVLQILIWLLPFLIITSIGFPLMTATHRERLNMYVIIASAILNVILNLALIPRFGAIGSSFASLLTIGVLNSMLTLYIIRDALRLKNMIVPVVKVGLSSLAMAIVIVLVNVNNLALYIAIGAVTYFIMLLLVRGISHDDVDIAQRILFKGEKREGALLSIIYRLTGDQ